MERLIKNIKSKWESFIFLFAILVYSGSLSNINILADGSNLALVSELIHLNYKFIDIYSLYKPILLTLLFLSFFISSITASRKLNDFLGITLIFQLVYQLIFSNILLFSTLKSNDVLLIEVLLLFVSTTICFGWIYWRVDKICITAGQLPLKLSGNEPFDYFYHACLGLHSRITLINPSKTKVMKLISYLHALILFDLFGLCFSHSIALAIKH